MLRAALVVMMLAGPAHATQEYMLPTLFDVAGVASDDVLNIRQRPDARAPIIGRLAADATGIEVVDQTSGWGRVNTGETSGWVSLRYLAYRTDVWREGALPGGFRCFGTEPFWDVRLQDGDLVLSGVEIAEQRHTATAVLGTGVFRDPTRAVVADAVTLVSTPQLCSDGMSERQFGLRATLIRHGKAPQLMSGCCAIQP
ncbi:SH3 domain-containing protein [Paracoccus salsus]|uniref:SH3 domain-containing protein n=1 Tax=Paracoccus salsus TaxID=2911061 RepID=UPI001F305DBD|nr:SH3 domain-containing protein [Paracoccus salsus]MCF3974398.1 SH3 domain-containing protein [Paracoccus salsus]